MNTLHIRLLLSAMALCIATSPQGHAQAQPIEAQRYKVLLNKANQGDELAQTEIGLMRIEGKAIERDLKMARLWLTKAAQRKHTPAQFHLGQLLMLDALGAKPTELQQQLQEGLHWLQQAAQAQHHSAQLLYSKLVLESSTPPLGHNKDNAQTLLLQCAQTHRPCAVFALSHLDKTPTHPNTPCTDNTPCHTIGKLLRTLAQHNDTQAMLRLASMPHENPVYWIRQAARLGHPHASYDLACLILNNEEPIQTDDPSVLTLLNTSAQQGHVQAMFVLAQLLYEGTRFPVNRPLALQWLERAKANGHGPANRLLNTLNNNTHFSAENPQ